MKDTQAMPLYYLNERANSNDNHIVHKAMCVRLPFIESKKTLGYFPECRDAIREAKKIYNRVNGCEVCISRCHES